MTGQATKKKRASLSKKLRFEVFKRDSFTCQYCGAKAPDVVLQCDHIEPVAKGGKDDILNLITSCTACNGGKGATPLSDDSALVRQRQQLAELEDRRQQIEMMVQWKTELAKQDDALVAAAEQELLRLTGYSFSAHGRAKAKATIVKCGFSNVFDAISLSVGTHGQYSAEGKMTDESASLVFSKIHAIAANLKKYGKDPDGASFAYIQGILRNRCEDRWLSAIPLLREMRAKGLTIEFMAGLAKQVGDIEEFEARCGFQLERQERASVGSRACERPVE